MEVVQLYNDKKHNRVSFILKGITATFANALRRTIIESVPTLAIEDVEITKNSSALYDEIIAHRLGLVPLTTDLKTYNLIEECKCKGEGCARCTVQMKLSAKGPCVAYASDIKSKDSAVKPVFPNTPIVSLLKNQEFEFQANAVLGKGSVHSKWSPALAYYKYKPIIEIKGNINKPDAAKDICPVDVFSVSNGRLAVNKDKVNDCHLCGACIDLEPNISVNESENEFIFFLESWGQLSHKEIMLKALDLIDQKYDEFNELVK